MDQILQYLTELAQPATAILERAAVILTAFFEVQQAIIIAVCLAIAFIANKRLRGAISKLHGRFNHVMWHRLMRTAASISLPIAWVFCLWIALLIVTSTGNSVGMIRLAASLINAWIIIRLASTFIPSAAWSRTFSWFAWSIAALNAIGQLDVIIAWMDARQFSLGSIDLTLWDFVRGVFITGLLLWGAAILSGIVNMRLARAKSLNPSMRVLLSKSSQIALYALAAIFGMQAVGIDLKALTIFSGALGLGIGLGMQRTVANLVAGFTMLMDKSIKPGDVIEIETGDGPTRGEVKNLSARFVSVMTRSGTETLIPNEILISNPVTNWSFSDKKVRRGLPVGVAYDTDVELAQALCIEAALKTPRILKDPPPVCLIKGFGDSSVDLELRFWLIDPEGGVANVSSAIYLNIWKLFQANKIEIPFPQRDLHIRSGVEAFSSTNGPQKLG